jgi:hypothetical protein
MNNSFQRQKIAGERDLYSIFAAKCYLALLDFKSAEFMFGIKRLEASLSRDELPFKQGTAFRGCSRAEQGWSHSVMKAHSDSRGCSFVGAFHLVSDITERIQTEGI